MLDGIETLPCDHEDVAHPWQLAGDSKCSEAFRASSFDHETGRFIDDHGVLGSIAEHSLLADLRLWRKAVLLEEELCLEDLDAEGRQRQVTRLVSNEAKLARVQLEAETELSEGWQHTWDEKWSPNEWGDKAVDLALLGKLMTFVQAWIGGASRGGQVGVCDISCVCRRKVECGTIKQVSLCGSTQLQHCVDVGLIGLVVLC